MNQRIKHGPFWTGLFSVISLAWLFPLALVLINSFKKKVYISADTFSLPTGKEFAGLFNYKDGIEKTNFIASFGWSLVITVGAVLLILLCTSMCAWWIVRVNNVASKIIYVLFLLNMIVPFQMVMLDWLQCIGQSDEAIRGFKLNMLLYELLSLLYSRFVSGVRRPELVRSGRNITMQIIGYMTSHRKQHLEATDVAREFGYGREHFCRLFRKATGKTFKEFLTDLRLDDACRKLSGSSASIASIARECGFPDTRALQTAVQRKYGIRAQEYRERYENRN